MSVDEDKVTCRSLSSLTQCGELPSTRPPKQRLGSQHRPLLHIEPDHIVVDILHLMLRIMDILLRNLIHLMAELDVATRQRGVTEHMDKFIAAVRSRGIIIMNACHNMCVQCYCCSFQQGCHLQCGRPGIQLEECSKGSMSGLHLEGQRS